MCTGIKAYGLALLMAVCFLTAAVKPLCMDCFFGHSLAVPQTKQVSSNMPDCHKPKQQGHESASKGCCNGLSCLNCFATPLYVTGMESFNVLQAPSAHKAEPVISAYHKFGDTPERPPKTA